MEKLEFRWELRWDQLPPEAELAGATWQTSF